MLKKLLFIQISKTLELSSIKIIKLVVWDPLGMILGFIKYCLSVCCILNRFKLSSKRMIPEFLALS